MNICYFVIGSESSGTKLMTQLLIDNGCYGDAGDEQRMDSVIQKDLGAIVFRRSLPHDGIWTDLNNCIINIINIGYAVVTIVMMRDWNATIQSQLKKGHVKTAEEAFENIKKAYHVLFQNALFCSYDELVIYPQKYGRWFLKHLGFNEPKGLEKITNQNRKYYL